MCVCVCNSCVCVSSVCVCVCVTLMSVCIVVLSASIYCKYLFTLGSCDVSGACCWSSGCGLQSETLLPW